MEEAFVLTKISLTHGLIEGISTLGFAVMAKGIFQKKKNLIVKRSAIFYGDLNQAFMYGFWQSQSQVNYRFLVATCFHKPIVATL